MPINDEDKALMEKAYDGSAETTFVIYLGKEIVSVAQTPADAALLGRLLQRLTVDKPPAPLSSKERERYRILQRLLAATYVSAANPGRHQPDGRPN